jgi:hypothetical protein
VIVVTDEISVCLPKSVKVKASLLEKGILLKMVGKKL